MDAAKNPQFLRRMSEAVEEFKDALIYFLSLHEETKSSGVGRGVIPAISPAKGVLPAAIQEAGSRVARAAGRAALAPGVTRMYVQVAGHKEPVDPVAAWRSMATPKPVLEPGDVLDATEQMLGRLEALTWKAEAELPPTTGVEAMHPTVWGAAKKLWSDGHFRLAVQSAAEKVTAHIKGRTGLHHMDATNMYEKVYSKAAPLLIWPGEPADKSVSSMQNGLAKYAPGVSMTIRNTATHDTETEMSAQDALERLAALSLLARWVDECENAATP
ncbi:TIGR02391 family protein [Streptomyces anulatus]